MEHHDVIVKEIDKGKIGLKLYNLRVKSGFKCEYVCERMGLESPRAIYKWESGKSLPALKHLVALSRLYHVSLGHILGCEGGEADASPLALLNPHFFVINKTEKGRTDYGKKNECKAEERGSSIRTSKEIQKA